MVIAVRSVGFTCLAAVFWIMVTIDGLNLLLWWKVVPIIALGALGFGLAVFRLRETWQVAIVGAVGGLLIPWLAVQLR